MEYSACLLYGDYLESAGISDLEDMLSGFTGMDAPPLQLLYEA